MENKLYSNPLGNEWWKLKIVLSKGTLIVKIQTNLLETEAGNKAQLAGQELRVERVPETKAGFSSAKRHFMPSVAQRPMLFI